MLRIRLITAAVLAGILIWLVSYSDSDLPLLGFLTLIVVLAGSEFVAMRWYTLDPHRGVAEIKRPPLHPEHVGIGIAYGFSLVLYHFGNLFFYPSPHGGIASLFTWMGACVIFLCGYLYRNEPDLNIATHKLFNALAGFSYVAFPTLVCFKLSQINISQSPRGIALYFACATVLMCDTGAYLCGRFFGKTKLIPSVSPKKTREGALGGLLFSSLTGLWMATSFNLGASWPRAVIVAFLAGFAGIVGDLTESALKRAAGVKDSGALLPGHGGILDRIDALIFGAPITYLLFLNFS